MAIYNLTKNRPHSFTHLWLGLEQRQYGVGNLWQDIVKIIHLILNPNKTLLIYNKNPRLLNP